MTVTPIAYAAATIMDAETRARVTAGLRRYGLHGAVVLSNPPSGRIDPLCTAVVIGEDEAGERLCLKLYEDSEDGRVKLRAHAGYLTVLRGRVLVPEVIGREETAECFGLPALVTSHLGEPLDYAIDSLSGAARRQVMNELADSLTILAALPPVELGLPAMSAEEVRTMTAESFASSTDWYCAHLPEDDERRALARRGVDLLRSFEAPPREARLCHQDLALCNVMVRGGRFSGLIDWDYAGLGAAERDLGSAVAGVLATLPAPQPERLDLLAGLLARYRARAGRDRTAQGWRLALSFALDSLLDWMIGDKNAQREDLVWATSLVVQGACGGGALADHHARGGTT